METAGFQMTFSHYVINSSIIWHCIEKNVNFTGFKKILKTRNYTGSKVQTAAVNRGVYDSVVGNKVT